MNKFIKVVMPVVVTSSVLLASCGSSPTNSSTPPAATTEVNQTAQTPSTEAKSAVKDLKGKKVYYIDSYNTDFPWSVGLTNGIQTVLKPTNAELKIFRMDTKNQSAATWAEQKAQEIKKEIDEYKPDLIICSDDAAVKFVIMPMFKDASIPVVSIGVNWNLDAYKMPYKNTAAMVEWTIDGPIFDHMKKFAKGNRIGFISGESLTAHKTADSMPGIFNIKWEKQYFVKDFNEFKEKWTALQDEVDMILFDNTGGIKGWDEKAAKEFTVNNSKIPSGAHYPWCAPMTLLGITEIAEEHGEWAAATAVQILSGEKKVEEIPVAQNKKGILNLNMAMAKKLNVTFDPVMLKDANIIN